jgi:hypothetical protein
MNIYYQKVGEDFFSTDVYNAYKGFDVRREHQTFFYEGIMEVPANKNSMIVGCIEDTVLFFNRLGVEIPKPLNIPDELNTESFLKRTIEVKTLQEFYDSWNGECPIFIKPYDKVKLFAGGVITKAFSKEQFYNLPSDTKVIVSNYIDMSSEYRCFINRGKIVGLKHYNTDFMLFPDIAFIKKAVETYKSAPISYSLDFAVSDNGDTTVIEANDGWSLGSYGLDSETYSRFLIDRWLQIIR